MTQSLGKGRIDTADFALASIELVGARLAMMECEAGIMARAEGGA